MRQMRPGRNGAGERGFALLLVFAMAAAIAILIYLEIPRVAFEHQREKEALLVDRGEQFIRAIQLYTKKLNKNPQTLDDLDKSQNIRFLRRRYKDPMTGSDEWRLIHVDAAGQYTDSKVHKKAGALDKVDNGPSILASTIQGIGASATLIDQSGEANSPALQRRASDRIIPGTAPGAGASGANPDGSAQPAEGAPVPSAPGQDQSQPQASTPAVGTSGTPPSSVGVFNNPFLPPAALAQAAAQQANQSGSGTAGQGATGSGVPSAIGQQWTMPAGGDATGTGAAAGQPATGSGPINQPSGLSAPTAPPAIQAIQQILGSQRGGATASATGASAGVCGPGRAGCGSGRRGQQEGTARHSPLQGPNELLVLGIRFRPARGRSD